MKVMRVEEGSRLPPPCKWPRGGGGGGRRVGEEKPAKTLQRLSSELLLMEVLVVCSPNTALRYSGCAP